MSLNGKRVLTGSERVREVAESHRLANIIERDIRAGIAGVRDVVVHIEPVSHEHEELKPPPQTS